MLKYPCGYPLLYHHNGHLWSIRVSKHREALMQLLCLIVPHYMHLSIPYTISEHNNTIW